MPQKPQKTLSTNPLSTRPLFRLEAQVAPPQVTSGGPYGDRRFIPVTGGRFDGERLSGTILPGGADCQLIRPDGAAELDVRVVLQCADGPIILMKGLGLRHGPPAVLARLAAGEQVAPDEYYFREAVYFEAPAGPYEWLNGLLAIGVGERLPDRVYVDMYEVL